MVIKTRSFIELMIAGILMLIGIITTTMVGVLALQQGIQTAQFNKERKKKNKKKNIGFSF